MKACILIEAGEGNTEAVIVADSKERLIETIQDCFNKQINEHSHENDKKFISKEKNSLIEMIQRHKEWNNGLYHLKNIKPQWQEWILVITDKSNGCIID